MVIEDLCGQCKQLGWSKLDSFMGVVVSGIFLFAKERLIVK